MDAIEMFEAKWNGEIESIKYNLDIVDWEEGIHTVEEVNRIAMLLAKYKMMTGQEYEIKSMEDSII